MSKKNIIHIIIGPLLFVLCWLLLPNAMGSTAAAQAIGCACWMIYWWVTAPVHLTVTAILPVITNAFLNMIPMGDVISQYACESIILIVGSTMLTTPWRSIGLDRRIALKCLALIGPSMKSQVIVWTLVTTVLSTVLPNIVVVSLLCPIAVAMIRAAGFDDVENSEPGQLILLIIAYAVSVGGMGTPMGGAMNVTSISALQDWYGIEFMYIDWIKRIIPLLIILTIVGIIMVLMIPRKINRLEGTKEFFQEEYKKLGAMKKTEIFSLAIFVIALVGSLTRTWWADFLPGLKPAYLFVSLGFLGYFICFKGKGVLQTWQETQDQIPFAAMILFAAGLALGKMLTGTGASTALGEILIGLNLKGGFVMMFVLVFFTRLVGECTNGTTAAALSCPIIFSLCAGLNINPIPYWFVNILAYNAEYMLPLSVRTVNVAYGMKPKLLMKYGWWQCLIQAAIVAVIGYASMQFIPGFGELVNFTWTPAA